MDKIVIALVLLIAAQFGHVAAHCEEPEQLGSAANPAISCKQIAIETPGAEDGIYYLRSIVTPGNFSVYCDIKSGGYTMVFKLASNTQGKAATMWLQTATVNENNTSVLNLRNDTKLHYKNRLVDEWRQFGPQEVVLSLYTAGQLNRSLVFDGHLSTKTSWFTKSRLAFSPYTDIISSTQNFFSILGDESVPVPETMVERNFFIQHAYLGCESDVGWLVAISGNEDICPWANLGDDYIRLKYSKLPTMANWNNIAQYANAHVMAVFLR